MSHNQQHHIVSAKTYSLVFIALLVLTVITVAAARIDFGVLNLTIAMVIAVIKATLVGLFFMGLYWEKGMARVAMIVSIGCLFIFILFTVLDFATRPSMDPLEGKQHSLKTPVTVVKHGSAHGSSEHGSSEGSNH